MTLAMFEETVRHWAREKYQRYDCSNNAQLFRSGEIMYMQQLFPWAPEWPFSPALLVKELPDVGFLEGSVPADCVVVDTCPVLRGCV